MASTRSSNWVEPWALAAESRTVRGMPVRSTTRWYLEPGLPRSVRLGPVCSPPFLARTLRLSRLARLQSRAASSPDQFRSVSCSRCQTPASCQSRHRLQQVTPLPHPSSLGNSPTDSLFAARRQCLQGRRDSALAGDHLSDLVAPSATRVQWLPRGRRGQGTSRSCSAIMPPRRGLATRTHPHRPDSAPRRPIIGSATLGTVRRGGTERPARGSGGRGRGARGRYGGQAGPGVVQR